VECVLALLLMRRTASAAVMRIGGAPGQSIESTMLFRTRWVELMHNRLRVILHGPSLLASIRSAAAGWEIRCRGPLRIARKR